MKTRMDAIEIEGVRYVPEDSVSQYAEPVDGMPYCIIRTYSAGVFAGYVKSRDGKDGVIINSRRLWQWFGASLSQVSQDGSVNDSNFKVPGVVPMTELSDIIEVLHCTEKARKSIQGLPEWEK